MSGGEALSADRPFPGLRPFGYDDRAFFFGREEQSYALYNLLDLSQFVAVVGSSGSGKSSLVRAGLLPLLERESEEVLASNDSVGRAWRWIELRPGDAPLSRLAEQLAHLAAGDSADPLTEAAHRERIDAALRRASFGMTEAVAGIETLANRSLLIVVDQFEELFRYGGHGAARARLQQERDQFVQLLLEATSGRQIDVHVLITMRSDFIGDCAQFHGLPEAVSACQFLVPSLTRDQREEVICRPLGPGLADTAIEPALVERLLNDAGSELDQLPVLQHCLSRLWEVAGPSAAAPPYRQLRTEHYTGVGGIADALSQHADLILAGLAGQAVAVEQVFRALSEVDNEGRATRRALSYADLLAETGVDDDELRRVVDRFRADDCSFLVPSITAVPELSERDTVDIGHEALLRRWRRIGAEAGESLVGEDESGWLEAEASDARFYRAMLALGAAHTLPREIVNEKWAWWRERPRTAAWAERYGGHIDRIEQLFANSLKAKWWRRVRIGASVAAGLLVGAILAGALYGSYQNQKQRELQKAEIIRENRIKLQLFRELTDMTEQMSTQLRFLPGSSLAIDPLLDRVELFATKFSQENATQSDVRDHRIVAVLKYTVSMLRSDYKINSGQIGEAIASLNADEAAVLQVPTEGTANPRALRLLDASIRLHRANGETLFGETDAARQDYQQAEQILAKLIDDDSRDAAAADPEQSQNDAEFSQRARQRLADLYSGRFFLENRFLADPAAAAVDFKTLSELVDKEKTAHPNSPDGHDQTAKFWAARANSLERMQGELWLAQGRYDDAIGIFRPMVGRAPPTATVLAEVGRAYASYQLGLALAKRGRPEDLIEATDHLEHANHVFARWVAQDTQNIWWPLLSAWIDRALGDAYRAEHDYIDAAETFDQAANLDQLLINKDKANRQAQEDEARDKASAAAARRSE